MLSNPFGALSYLNRVASASTSGVKATDIIPVAECERISKEDPKGLKGGEYCSKKCKGAGGLGCIHLCQAAYALCAGSDDGHPSVTLPERY